MGDYQVHCLDLTSSDLEPRYGGQISDLRRLAACRPISLKFKYVRQLCIANNSCKFRTGRTTASEFNKIFSNYFETFAVSPFTGRFYSN